MHSGFRWREIACDLVGWRLNDWSNSKGLRRGIPMRPQNLNGTGSSAHYHYLNSIHTGEFTTYAPGWQGSAKGFCVGRFAPCRRDQGRVRGRLQTIGAGSWQGTREFRARQMDENGGCPACMGEEGTEPFARVSGRSSSSARGCASTPVLFCANAEAPDGDSPVQVGMGLFGRPYKNSGGIRN
jgi:hypothetical protein